MPIRARIALFGAAVVAVTVVLFGILVYVLVQRNLASQQDDTLQQRGQQAIRFRGLPDRPFLPPDLGTSSETFVEILDSSGTPVFSTGQINGQDPAVPAALLRSVTVDHPAFSTLKPKSGLTLRVYVQLLSRPDLGLSGYVMTGQSMAGIDHQLDLLRVFLLGGALLSLLGALGASWLMAGRALRPIEQMAVTAEEIGRTQDLSRRLPNGGTGDEVSRLQASFNQMLSRLDEAYRRLQEALAAQRRFVADASHELRTPLTSIRGNIGLLLHRPDVTGADQGAALQDIAGESERMSRLVADLLTLARADSGQHLEKTRLNLRAIVQDVCRQALALDGHRQIDLADGPPAEVAGNADALRQLTWILVDNAISHTPDGGHIRLELIPDAETASLTVSDEGPGIPAGDLERIFERFYRADSARSGDGTGLGLAIARSIVGEHAGRITAGNRSGGGATFRVDLPLAKS